ncbi:MAG: outer membrane protein assembly factor BamE [Gammaproteobacteria bacterium]|nr:outer membrane protein assembly factor BamE [Gammaproteobacteria bacterium]
MQKILIQIISLAILTSCSVYRAELQQGNLISQESVAMLRVGMDKREVQKILGTPMVRHAFTRDRWDYFYSLKQDGKLVKKTNLSLSFNKNRLTQISGKAAE